MAKKAKKKVRKIKYYKKTLKIPESQNKKLRKFCKAGKLTENKVFRMALREFLNRNVHLINQPHYDVSANQLSLFDFVSEDEAKATS
jgi:hypothetical protein